jgi:hypothetical protein
MSADKRKTADAMRNRGPEGERIVEHKADQYIDAEEGRPREN